MLERLQRAGGNALALLIHHQRQAAVGEIIGRRDAVVEKIERAVQRAPVDVVGVGMARVARHGVDPAVEREVRAEPARAAGEQVAVRGEEARRDEGAVGVDDLGGAEIARRLALLDRDDPPMRSRRQPAAHRLGVCVGEGQQHGVADDEGGVHESSVATKRRVLGTLSPEARREQGRALRLTLRIQIRRHHFTRTCIVLPRQ